MQNGRRFRWNRNSVFISVDQGCFFSFSGISTRMISLPIWQMRSHGITKSSPWQKKPQNFTGPGRTSPVRCPVFGLNSTSIGQPSVLQSGEKGSRCESCTNSSPYFASRGMIHWETGKETDALESIPEALSRETCLSQYRNVTFVSRGTGSTKQESGHLPHSG